MEWDNLTSEQLEKELLSSRTAVVSKLEKELSTEKNQQIYSERENTDRDINDIIKMVKDIDKQQRLLNTLLSIKSN
jgi:Mg2+ and Co2+ transporter CorA